MEENKIDYCLLAENLYSLINSEIEQIEAKKTDLAQIYPKLVICGEFFRYIRGEFFHSIRQPGLDCQKRMYQLEKQLTAKISKLRKDLNKDDSRTAYFLDLSKKLFD